MVGCSRRWGLEFKENAWLDMLGVVIGPENAWNLGGREGVRKEVVRVSAWGSPQSSDQVQEGEDCACAHKQAALWGRERGLVRNANSQTCFRLISSQTVGMELDSLCFSKPSR